MTTDTRCDYIIFRKFSVMFLSSMVIAANLMMYVFDGEPRTIQGKCECGFLIGILITVAFLPIVQLQYPQKFLYLEYLTILIVMGLLTSFAWFSLMILDVWRAARFNDMIQI